MFGWLRNRNRRIFRFWDGSRTRSIDPAVVMRTLFCHPEFNWRETPLLGDSADPKIATEAIALEARAVREAFGLGPFADGRGLTETECCELLGQFNLWCMDVKKKRNPSPTTAEFTEPPESGLATKSDSDSCLTSPASNCDDVSESSPVLSTG